MNHLSNPTVPRYLGPMPLKAAKPAAKPAATTPTAKPVPAKPAQAQSLGGQIKAGFEATCRWAGAVGAGAVAGAVSFLGPVAALEFTIGPVAAQPFILYALPLVCSAAVIGAGWWAYHKIDRAFGH